MAFDGSVAAENQIFCSGGLDPPSEFLGLAVLLFVGQDAALQPRRSFRILASQLFARAFSLLLKSASRFFYHRQHPFPRGVTVHRLRSMILDGDHRVLPGASNGDGGGNLVHMLSARPGRTGESFGEIFEAQSEPREALSAGVFRCLCRGGGFHYAAPQMEVIIKATAEEVSKEAGALFRRQLRERPASVLGLATGSTPLGLYRELIELAGRGEIDLSSVTTFNLDEYCGLAGDHPCSYRYYMQQNLFAHVSIAAEKIHLPDGLAPDIPAHCAEYERKIQALGGIDLQLLGLGSDGHIGFNEPSSSLCSRTRIKTLTERTIADNVACFGSEAEMPRHVITMGVGTIMESHQCLVLALGAKKAEAVAATVEGPITANVPASILQMHPRCVLILDEPAAAQLGRRSYYDWVYQNKPAWQQS